MSSQNKKIKIAVTGVGGGVGQSIIKSLYETDYSIVGLDGETLGAGLYAVPEAYKIPYAKHPDFISVVLNICEKEGCSIIFPGMDAELYKLSESRDLFKAIGTTVVVSEPEVIEICDNKLLTFSSLEKKGINVPFTDDFGSAIANINKINFPVIVKPKTGGFRSKSVYQCKNKSELEKIYSDKDFNTENYIIQEYIEGDEYTCGSVNFDGICYGVIIMRRILRDGDTYKCFVTENARIEEEVYKVMNVLKPYGACNVQLRLKDGVPYVFEINARCSGTTGARSLSGFNEPKMICDFVLKGERPEYSIKKTSILRYWKELVVDNEKINKLSANSFLLSSDFTEL